MKGIFILVASMLLFLNACDNTDKRVSDSKKRVINMETIAEFEFQDLFKVSDIVPLETSKEALIGIANKMIVQNEQLYVLDKRQKAIFIFDLGGNLIKKIHKVGKGEGEYLDIADFTVNPYTKNIEMIDSRVLRIYNQRGDFINQLKVVNKDVKYVHKIEIIDSLNIGFISSFADENALVYSRDKKRYTSKQCIYPAWARKIMPFGSFEVMSRNDGKVVYFEAFSNQVYSVDKSGYHLSYEWDFGQYNFNYEEPPLLNVYQNCSSQKEADTYSEKYAKKYIVQLQNRIENRIYQLTNFFFHYKPATLIYRKDINKYIIFNGELSGLFTFSKNAFIDQDRIMVIIDPKKLKDKPKKWFSEKNLKTIKDINIINNPVVLILKLKNNIFE